MNTADNEANNYCRILTLLGMEEEGDPVAEVARLVAAAELVSGVAPKEVRMLTDADMEALSRFNETCEDGQGYDLPKDRMKRLAELGVVQWCGASRYSMTAFGQYVLDLLPEGWPRLPLKTHAEHDDYANAAIKEQAVKPATEQEQK